MRKFVPLIPVITGGFFACGYQINRIDTLFNIAHAQGIEMKDVRDVIYDIHGKVCIIETILKKKD